MELPRPYISHSQMEKWFSSRSKKAYIDYYYGNKPTFETAALRLGKQFASEKELGLSLNPVHQFLIDMLPERAEYDKETRVIWEGHEILIKEDAKDDTGFDEYKTGTVPWTQERVDDSWQMNLYAFGRKLQGKTNDKCNLFWMPSHANPETRKLELTGEIVSFERTFTEENYHFMAERIRQYVDEVKHYTVLDLR